MRSFFKVVIICLFLVAFVAMTGCTRHPNEEQINGLEETIKASNAAQAELDDKVTERKGLENEVKEWEAKVQAAQKEKAAVEARLQKESE